MSPAITDGERFGGFHVCQIRLSDSASWSFCLIGVLIGVGARDFLCSTVAFGPDIFLFRVVLFKFFSGEPRAENKTSRALAGAHSSYACSPRQLQRVRCSACSRLQC